MANVLALLCLTLTCRLPAQLPEAEALEAKGRADYVTMRAEFTRLLGAAVAVDAADQAAAAYAEYCATMLLRMLGDGGDETSMPAVAAARLAPLSRRVPALRGRLGSLLLQARRDHGGELQALADELGVLRTFWLCGPFDNERGAGYGRALEPETRFLPDASYDGKVRPVGWRQLPAHPPAGHLDLAEVLRPNEQVMVYLATALVAEHATDAALWLGSTGAVRVLLNGREVFARDVEREVHDDQDAAVLPLQPGSNLLVVKVCHQEGRNFAVRLRVCALDGAPLPAVRGSDAAADLLAANAQTARDAAAGAVVADNARSFYAAAARAEDAAAALRLCAILVHNRIDGDRDPRPRRLAEQAVAGLPDCAEAAFLRYWARPHIVHSQADRDENPQRRDLAEVLRRQPDHVEARLLLADHELDGSALPGRAEQLLREAMAIQPNSSLAHGKLADVYEALGLEALRDRSLEDAGALPAASVSTLRNLAYRRYQAGDLEAARAAGDRLLAQWFHPLDVVLAGRIRLRQGDLEGATALLRGAIARRPTAKAPRAALANAQAGRGDAEGALETWARWLEVCPEDDEALLAVAELHAARGDRERQVEVLRAAVELNPNLSDAQRYLDWLQADQAPFYAAFELDGAAILAADGGPPADAAASQDGLHHILQQRVVKAFANGTTSEYRHQVTRILREEGARQFASWRLPYWYGSQRARLLACVVRHPDGSSEHPRLQGPAVAIRSLQPGDIVEIKGRIDDLAPSFFGTYFGLEHRFPSQDGAPVARSLLTVVTTPGRDYRWQAANGAPEPHRTPLADGEERYDWEMTDLPRDEPEVARPSRREREPLVRMTTYRDWDHFATWWWNLIEKQIDVTPPMRAKVRELCGEARTPAEKLDAIYRFVTTDVRYEAWEFGVHGYKPYNTSVIFERRHGDCKDKALLLCALLREAGIVARPVLIFAADPHGIDDLSVPLVNHFNHCIAWLPEQDGIASRFLDGTANLHPSDLVPTMDQGAHVLVVEPDGAELLHVPWTDPEHNADRRELGITLARDGSAEVAMALRPTGNEAVALRHRLVSAPATLREQLERQLLARFGKARIELVDASDGQDLGAPAELRVTFRADEMALRQGDKLVWKGAFDSRMLQQLTATPERHTPLLLGAPRREHELLRVSLPPGMRAGPLPVPAKVAEEFGSYSLTWRRDGEQVLVERDLKLAVPRLTLADYAAFRAFVAAVQDADGALLVIEPEGGSR